MSEALQPVLLVGVIIFVVMLCFIVHLNDLMKDARKDMARLLAERETLRLQFSQFYQLLAAGWTIDQQRTFANALETRWYLKAPDEPFSRRLSDAYERQQMRQGQQPMQQPLPPELQEWVVRDDHSYR